MRAMAALILIIFAGDVALDILLSQRLYLADVLLFGKHIGADLSVVRAGLASGAGLLLAFVGLLVIVVALGICFPARRRARFGAVCLVAALCCATFSLFEAIRPVRYMNVLVVDNVVEANLPQGRVAEFSASFVARQRDLVSALPQRCEPAQARTSGSVIVLMVESLSAWHSQLLDGTHDWTPRLDAIARGNHFFRNFYANGFTTSTGTIATITGKVPFVPPGKPWFDFSDYADPQGSLPDIAHHSGRDAAFFTTEDVSFLNLGNWLRRIGFDVVDSNDDPFYADQKHAQFGGYEDAALYARFLKWLDGRAPDQPFISVLVTISSHPPFVDPRTSNIDPQATIRYVDEQIGKFHDGLRQRGFFDHGVLLVLGDHRTMTPLHEDEFLAHGERAFARIPWSSPVPPTSLPSSMRRFSRRTSLRRSRIGGGCLIAVAHSPESSCVLIRKPRHTSCMCAATIATASMCIPLAAIARWTAFGSTVTRVPGSTSDRLSRMPSRHGSTGGANRLASAAATPQRNTSTPRAENQLDRRPALSQATSIEESLGSVQGVFDQRRDRHRADPAGHRCDPRRALGSGCELDIADQATVVESVDSDIDHDRTRLDPVALDQAGAASGHDDDVALAYFTLEVDGEPVATGGGATCQQ
jgi:hypothetical protein